MIWQSHLFDTVPAPAPATVPIPEPGTAAMITLWSSLLWLRRGVSQPGRVVNGAAPV